MPYKRVFDSPGNRNRPKRKRNCNSQTRDTTMVDAVKRARPSTQHNQRNARKKSFCTRGTIVRNATEAQNTTDVVNVNDIETQKNISGVGSKEGERLVRSSKGSNKDNARRQSVSNGNTKRHKKPKAPEGAKNFVLTRYCEVLLDVILANRQTYLTIEQGKTHATKTNARIKLTKALVTADKSLESCFGNDEFIESSGAGKVRDIIAMLKKKYTKAISDSKATGAGADGEDRAWRTFAERKYEVARDKAHQLFHDSSAVHLHSMRSNDKEGGFLNPLGSMEHGAGREVINSDETQSDGFEKYVTLEDIMNENVPESDGEYAPNDDGDNSPFSLSQEEIDGTDVGSTVRQTENSELSTYLHNIDPAVSEIEPLVQKRKNKPTSHSPANAKAPSGPSLSKSLAQRRADSLAAMARRTTLGKKKDKEGKNENDEDGVSSAAGEAIKLLKSMNHTESMKKGSYLRLEKETEIKAREEAGEARARAKAIEAETLRKNLSQAMGIMQSNVENAAKAIMLKAMGLDDLANQYREA